MDTASRSSENGRSGLKGAVEAFLSLESAAGICLMGAALVAIIIANSPLAGLYEHILNGVKFRVGLLSGGHDVGLEKTILHWINDGFMAIFFFLVGLEIKREFAGGELSSREKALLPILGAAGGMIVPALIFLSFNKDFPAGLSGWAIPAATDIAFALGVLSLLGSRVPVSLKVLLAAIAVIDDLGAIVVIALFYSSSIDLVPLSIAFLAIVGLSLLNKRGITASSPYVMLAILLWLCVLESGVHATLAGVVSALFVPVKSLRNPSFSLCQHMEHKLHPWVAFGILPLFAFANAGVSFLGLESGDFLSPVTLGIMAGLFFGKQIGVFSAIFLAVFCKISPKPESASWVQIYAVSVLCGIGFTMSLFIGSLAYAGSAMQETVRLGVLSGSLLSAVAGYALMRYATKDQGRGTG